MEGAGTGLQTLFGFACELLDAALSLPGVLALSATLVPLALLWRASRSKPRRVPRGTHVPPVTTDGGERARIDAFLATKRIALVGASSRPDDFSRVVMRALIRHGIDVVPVNPILGVMEGQQVSACVTAIVPPVEAALIMTPPAVSVHIVEQCGAATIRKVWLHRGAGHGSVSDEAVRAAEAHGLELVSGRCPLMFLGERPAWIHRAHATLVQIRGRYPARTMP